MQLHYAESNNQNTDACSYFRTNRGWKSITLFTSNPQHNVVNLL